MPAPAATRRRLRRLGAHLREHAGTRACASSESSAHRDHDAGLPAPVCHAEDLLDMGVVAKFDPEAFARDGLWIWEGVLTPKGCAKMKEACMRTQRMNDMWNEHDWQQHDWEAMGLKRPAPPDREKVIAARGGGQMGGDTTAGSGINAGGLQNRAGIRAPLGPGFKPEGCCLAWDREDNPLAVAAGLSDSWCMMNMITHPQMLEAHRMMLGPVVRFDHNTILSRKEGYAGQGWHGHDYYDDDHFTWKEGEGYVHTMSGGGARSHPDKFIPLDSDDPSAQYGPYVPGRDGPIRRCGPTELGLVRSLIYPDGFAAVRKRNPFLKRHFLLERIDHLSRQALCTHKKRWNPLE
eukprot:COSAG06_NODE_754_length_12544_cov_3.858337_4_plen_349_part_00